MATILRLNNINKSYGDGPRHRQPVLQKIDLEIKEGEFFVFVGPSGCGKSTLLRIMSGLEKDYEGTLEWKNPQTPQEIGFVFQQFALLPWLTVYQNVELPLLRIEKNPAKRKSAIEHSLERLGLAQSAKAFPHQLSGGMRQRVGIARAFVAEPHIVFMDEAFSELDSFIAEELRNEVLGIWKEKKTTIIMVTHLLDEAIKLADRIAVLTPRPGNIEKITINRLPRPRQPRSPEFYELEDRLFELIRP